MTLSFSLVRKVRVYCSLVTKSDLASAIAVEYQPTNQKRVTKVTSATRALGEHRNGFQALHAAISAIALRTSEPPRAAGVTLDSGDTEMYFLSKGRCQHEEMLGLLHQTSTKCCPSATRGLPGLPPFYTRAEVRHTSVLGPNSPLKRG